MVDLRALCVLVAAAALASCSPGSSAMNGSTLPSPPSPSSAPTTAPTTAPSTAPSTSPTTAPSATPAPVPQLPMTFTIPTMLVQSAGRVPLGGRSAAGASTETLTVTINSINGSTTLPANVAAKTQIILTLGGNCTQSGSGEVCTVTIPAPPGTVSYSFDITDGGSNAVVATFTLTATNVAGQNSVGGGQQPVAADAVKSVSLALTGTLTPGTAADIPVTVTPRDARGNVITGSKNFARPINLADGETSAATGLSLDGGALAKTISIASPAHTVTLHYDGTAIPPFALTASGDTFPTTSMTVTPGSGTIAIAGTTLDTLSASDPNYKRPTLYFDLTGKTRAFSASEPGWSDHGHGFTVTPDPATCGSGASAVVTVASSDQLTFNVTSAHYGLCKLTVADGLGTSTPVWASVSTANIGVH